MEVKKIAVLGAGLMGHGIAQVAAQVGKFEVSLRDIRQEFLDRGMNMIRDSLQRFRRKGLISEGEVEETLSRIHPTLNLQEAVGDADLVIEAVPENLELKKGVFREVDQLAREGAILASNTSSLSITELASATKRPQNVCGMHFFNPPQLMKLVEVVRGAETSDETIRTVVEVARRMGKEPVVVKKDVPGFIVNRILIPALNEAAHLELPDLGGDLGDSMPHQARSKNGNLLHLHPNTSLHTSPTDRLPSQIFLFIRPPASGWHLAGTGKAACPMRSRLGFGCPSPARKPAHTPERGCSTPD